MSNRSSLSRDLDLVMQNVASQNRRQLVLLVFFVLMTLGAVGLAGYILIYKDIPLTEIALPMLGLVIPALLLGLLLIRTLALATRRRDGLDQSIFDYLSIQRTRLSKLRRAHQLLFKAGLYMLLPLFGLMIYMLWHSGKATTADAWSLVAFCSVPFCVVLGRSWYLSNRRLPPQLHAVEAHLAELNGEESAQ